MNDTTTVRFATKHPKTTNWIEVQWSVDAGEPTELFDALAEIGFVSDGFMDPPPFDGKMDRSVSKSGSGLFGGWVDEERSRFMREARAVLRRFGFTRVPVYTYSAMELI